MGKDIKKKFENGENICFYKIRKQALLFIFV